MASPPCILLVDDEPAILRALKRVLEDLPLEILTAGSGPEGLELLHQREAAVIISDQRMPGMTGDEFLRRARKLQPCAVRIVLTGYADMDAAMALINTGGLHRFIAKPWDDAELRMTVRNAIALYEATVASRRLSEELEKQNETLRRLNDELNALVAQRTAGLEEANARLREALRREREMRWSVLDALAGLLEMAHPSLHGHSRRVAARAEALARHIGLDGEQLELVRAAALLHDIGKIAVPDRLVVCDPDRLAGADRDLVRRHPERGQSIVEGIEGLQAAGPMIRGHHERYDGRGYPDGHAGDAIDLGARIIAVADAFDHALAGEREGGVAAMARAFRKLHALEGRALDPSLVGALGRLMNLEDPPPDQCRWVRRLIEPERIEPPAVLAHDVLTRDGALAAGRGSTVDAGVAATLARLARSGRIDGPLVVYVAPPQPQAAAADGG